MSEIKQQVQDWISSGKDYNDGLLLLSRNFKNKAMIRNLSMNPNPIKADKLLYELLKLAGMKDDYVQQSVIINPPSLRPRAQRRGSNPPKNSVTKVKAKVISPGKGKTIVPPAGSKASEIRHSVPFNKLPLIVQEVIKQKGRLYMKREQLHAILTNEKTQDNKPKNVKARKEAGVKIDHFSKRIDELYEAEKSFKETGAAIPESIMDWNEDLQTEIKNVPAMGKLSDLELKNRLTNLKTYFTKETNMLKFQTQSAQKEENPMPAGPKREKMEHKVEARKLEIEAIEAELKKRTGKKK